MLSNNGMELLAAVLVAVLMVRFWRQLFTLLLITSITIFCFGLVQIMAVLEI
jgi:hypothetical protein